MSEEGCQEEEMICRRDDSSNFEVGSTGRIERCRPGPQDREMHLLSDNI